MKTYANFSGLGTLLTISVNILRAYKGRRNVG